MKASWLTFVSDELLFFDLDDSWLVVSTYFFETEVNSSCDKTETVSFVHALISEIS